MRAREAEFHDAGARLVVIGLGDRAYARAFLDEQGISFPLLVDEGREAYRAAGLRRGSFLHLFRRDNLRAFSRARSAGHRQGRLGGNPFQLGGSFVFGPGNAVLFSHVSRTFGDNADAGALLAAVRGR